MPRIAVSRSLAVIVLPITLAVSTVAAQRPRVSPHETHEFVLDGAKFSFEYGRPSTRGRVIWGALVPWDRWWMPGADEATILTSDAAMLLADTLEVPAGRHTIYMLPSPDVSKLIINKEVGQFHTRYTPRLDLGRVDLQMRTLAAPVEQLTFSIEPRQEGGGLLKLTWADREYSVPVALRR
jgi:hypothetical protein